MSHFDINKEKRGGGQNPTLLTLRTRNYHGDVIPTILGTMEYTGFVKRVPSQFLHTQ